MADGAVHEPTADLRANRAIARQNVAADEPIAPESQRPTARNSNEIDRRAAAAHPCR